MPTKRTTNKLSQLYKTIDQKELSADAKKALADLRLATGNFRKQEGKEADAFMLFYNRLVNKKPTAVKTTKEYKAMLTERRRENGRKAMEARKAKQESRQGQGSEKDAARPAKPFGWRLKGKHNYRKPTRADIRTGKAYYEARINRADTKRTKFPMLERGGYMAKGGAIKNQYEGREAEDIWNNLTFGQRLHFLKDHESDLKLRVDGMPLKDYFEETRVVARLKFAELKKKIQDEFEVHTIMGQYADGGFMEHGGDVDKDGMIYALRELVPSMVISKKTNVDYWSGIEFIRQRAIEYYINNGDVPYSDEELDRVLTMIGWEYGTFEGYMEHGGEVDKGGMIYALRNEISGGTIANKSGVDSYDDIAKVRRMAIQYYLDNGDVNYSLGELDRVLAMVGAEMGTKMAKGGKMDSLEDKIAKLEGKELYIYFMGVEEPTIQKIKSANISSPTFRERTLFVVTENGAESRINGLDKIDAFLRGNVAIIRDSHEDYGIALVKKMAKGGVFYTDSHKQGH